MFWKTPIFRNFCHFFGPIEPNNIKQFPCTINLHKDAEMVLFLKNFVAREISKAFLVQCRVNNVRLTVPISPDECSELMIDFVGDIQTEIVFAHHKPCVYSCGKIFLPIGLFVDQSDSRFGSGRTLLDGKEKVITFSESIQSDYPYLTPSKQKRTANSNGSGGKVHKEIRMFDMETDNGQEQQKNSTTIDGEYKCASVKCAYKCFNISPHVIDILVDDRGLCTVKHSGLLPVRLEYFRYPSNRRIEKHIHSIALMCIRKWKLCSQLCIPISNTNDYVLKTLSSPSQMIINYWKKCIIKEIRLRNRIQNFRQINLRAILLACSPYRMKRMLKCGKTNFFQEDRSWNHEKCTQVVDAENILSGLCQEYRVVPSYFKTKKQNYMRQIHASQCGIICPILTPDGANIGMIRHLCDDVRISAEYDPKSINRVKRYVRTLLAPAPRSDSSSSTTVLLLFNGVPLGWLSVDDIISIHLKNIRQKLIDKYKNIGIHYDDGSALYCYYGVSGHVEKRIYEEIISKETLLPIRQGHWRNIRTIRTFAEYFVPLIEKKFHPINDIQEYGAHNEAPRNSLASGMIKQASSSNRSGSKVANSEWKHLLAGDPPIRDMTETFGAYVNFILIPHESTQEDSIVVSQRLVQEKFLRENEKILISTIPPDCTLQSSTIPPSKRHYDTFKQLRVKYKNLYMCPRTGIVSYRLGKTLPSREPIIFVWTKQGSYCQPLVYSQIDPSNFKLKEIDLVCKGGSEYSVRYKIFRCLSIEIGDKVQTKHGNKGVISQILPDGVMLRTRNNKIKIDAYCHPVPLIKRQQIGHIIEAQRNGVIIEEIIDPTTNISLGQMEIHRVYMFVLKQLSRDKCHMRRPDDILPLVRQPPEGRANNGGCKLGEMECQGILSTGATHLLNDLLKIPGHSVPLDHCRGCGEFFDFNFKTLHMNTCNKQMVIRSVDRQETRYCFHILNNLLSALQRRRIVLSSKKRHDEQQ